MNFLSADGFPITLDGVVEFRILPDKVAEMFVKYNEDANGDAIDEEIIAKIITPESRSLCRIGGSKLSGGQFISGEDREKFQTDLVKSLTENCQKQGIEILAVAITSIQPPDDIAQPVQQREVAKQKLAQFRREKLQQLSEAKLKVEVVLAEQKKRVVEAEQEVVEKTTKAEQEQQVAVTLAEQKLKVAQTQLEAAKDKASAILAKAEADADVIKFDNAAEAAGLAAQVSAFDGDGAAMARNMLLGKIAPVVPHDPGQLGRPADGPVQPVHPAARQVAVAARRRSVHTLRRQSDIHVPIPSRRAGRGQPAGAVALAVRSIAGRHFRGEQAMNPFRSQSLSRVAGALLVAVLLVLVGYFGIWQWMFCRIEVPPGSSLLVRYKGPWPFGSRPQAPEGTLVQTDAAGRPLQVGILEAMPGPGRHFYSPLEYETQLVKDEVIPPGKIGVVVSKIGKPLPEGTYLVDAKGYRGILRKVLTPGAIGSTSMALTSRSSMWTPAPSPAPQVKRKAEDPTLIPPGYVGVVTNKASDPRTEEDRGIQQQVLQPGIYFLNPEEKRIDIVSIGYSETSLMVEAPGREPPGRLNRLPRMAAARPRATGWERRRPTTRSTSRARGSSSPRATAFRSTSTTRRSGAFCPSRRPMSSASSARSRTSSRR